MSALLNVSPLALLDLWADLIDAEYGKASHGSTAEIYAYRFQQIGPASALNRTSSFAREDFRDSARALHDLLDLFANKRRVTIAVNDRPLGSWLLDEEFDHRVHVTIAARSP